MRGNEVVVTKGRRMSLRRSNPFNPSRNRRRLPLLAAVSVLALATVPGALNSGADAAALPFITAVSADLFLSGTSHAFAAPVTGSTPTRFTMTVSNNGPSDAHNVVVRSTMPANVSFISATGGATPVNGILDIPLGTIAVGGYVSFEVREGVGAGVAQNEFTATGLELDPKLSNNTTNLGSVKTGGTTTYSTECELEFVTETSKTNTVETYSTRLITKAPNGTVLSDETFTVPFADPAVQAAVTAGLQRTRDAGAVTVDGPTQRSSARTRALTTTSVVTKRTRDESGLLDVDTTELVGEDVFEVKEGVIEAFSRPDPNGHIVVTGGTTQTVYVASGDTVLHTLGIVRVNVDRSTTVTDTFVTSSVYEITGSAPSAPAPVEPAPAALPPAPIPAPVVAASSSPSTIPPIVLPSTTIATQPVTPSTLPSTTTPPTVAPVVTVPATDLAASSAIPTAVLGAAIAAPIADEPIAYTGASSRDLALVAVSLIGLGVVLRRRSTRS